MDLFLDGKIATLHVQIVLNMIGHRTNLPHAFLFRESIPHFCKLSMRTHFFGKHGLWRHLSFWQFLFFNNFIRYGHGFGVVWPTPLSGYYQLSTNIMDNIFPGQAEHWNWTEAFEVSICRSICRTLGKTLGRGADNQDWTVRIFQLATVTRVSIVN